MNKKTIIGLIVLGLVIIGAIIGTFVMSNDQQPVEEISTTTTITKNITVSKTKAITTQTNSVTSLKKDEANNSDGDPYRRPEKDADQYYYNAEGIMQIFTGVTEYTLNGKKDFYYFKDGKYDPSYSGMAQKYLSYGDEDWYYVKAGRVDRSFSGFVSYNNYMRLVKNGEFYKSYTGRVRLFPDQDYTYDIKEGTLLGYDMGYKDGLVKTYGGYQLLDE